MDYPKRFQRKNKVTISGVKYLIPLVNTGGIFLFQQLTKKGASNKLKTPSVQLPGPYFLMSILSI